MADKKSGKVEEKVKGKQGYLATIKVVRECLVSIDADSLAKAVEVAEHMDPESVWSQDVDIEDVFSTSLYVESISGPTKELK